MSLFGDRLSGHLTYMGLLQTDIEKFKLANRSTLNGYITQGASPTWTSGTELLYALGLSAEYMTNPDETERWNATVRKLQYDLRPWARTVPGDLDAYQRTLAVIGAIMERLPQAQAWDWWMPSIVNLGGVGDNKIPGAAMNRELYQQFINGEWNSTTIRRAVQRLAEFTHLPSVWIQLGQDRLLDGPAGDVTTEWREFIAAAERLGHSPRMYRENLQTTHELFQSLRLLH